MEKKTGGNKKIGIKKAGETDLPVIGPITSPEEANMIIKICGVCEYMEHIRSLTKTA